MADITKKIICKNSENIYFEMTREKLSGSIGRAETILFDEIKSQLKKGGVAATIITIYGICSLYFGTCFIRDWNKSKYNELLSYNTIIDFVNKKSDPFKIEKFG